MSKWCTFAKPYHSPPFTSGKLFVSRKELEHLWFYSFCEAQQVGLTKGKGSCYVHSNLRLASRRGPKYGNGPSKEWDVDPESLDLKLS